MQQAVIFTANSSDFDEACKSATLQSNVFIDEMNISCEDTVTQELRVSHVILDGIVWHYAVMTLAIDCSIPTHKEIRVNIMTILTQVGE